jgi:hypothetical protein
MKGTRTASGVFVFDDFRDNLIIDRYDAAFATMRGAKIEHLRSENSEDALTWNVFRTFRQIDPTLWFPRLFAQAFHAECEIPVDTVRMRLWPSVSPPPSLRLFQKDEGDSEVDVVLETEYLVWFVETKYRSDVSTRTTNNPKRDQILRMIDVGSWYAGTRDFFFSLLVLDEQRTSAGVSLAKEYMTSKDALLSRLPHRRDRFTNLRGIGLLKWADLAAILLDCSQLAIRDDERLLAKRALEWLRAKGIGSTSTAPRKSETHGYRSKEFTWEYEPGVERLLIESVEGIKHEFSLQEIRHILKRLDEQFGDEFFPLGNNVEKLGDGTEVLGLGTTILEQRPGDVSHAQGASYLGVVLEECGYLEWNEQRRGIRWCLIQTDFSKEAILAALQGS